MKHAGFNEECRSRRHQKMSQVENAERVEVIINSPSGILHRNTLKHITIKSDFEAVKLGDIVRVHDSNYIGEVIDACNNLDEDELCEFDGDTHFSKQTWESCTKAAGSCIEACTQIMNGKAKNAFCLIRPPGHHAGVYGKVGLESPEIAYIQEKNPDCILST